MEDYLQIETVIQRMLLAGDFNDTRTMHGAELLREEDEYYGTPMVRKCEENRIVDFRGSNVGSEHVYTVAVRCMGCVGWYNDENELNKRIRRLVSYALTESGFAVRSITHGELERNHVTKRLERTVVITLAGYQRYTGE